MVLRSQSFRCALLFTVFMAAGACQQLALGEQKIAVIIANQPGTPFPHTPDEIRDIMFSKTNPSVDSYWREVSYGKTWATGDVFGPVQLDRTYGTDLNSNNAALDFCVKALAGQADFRTFDQIALIYPMNGYSGWGGHAGLAWFYDGGAVEVVFLTASPQRLPRDGAPYFTLLHELTHNLGAGHSMIVDFARDPVGPAGTEGTYDNVSSSDRAGNYMTPMGGPIFGHLEAPMKYHLGWLDMGAGVKDIETGGTFRLEPLETGGTGTKALRIRRGPGLDQWFWVEYRQPSGIDRAISTRTTQVFSGPLVYLEEVRPPDYPVPPCALGGRLCNPFYLLDMTPQSAAEDFNDAALAGGKSWSDPYGPVTIQVGSVSADGADVTVGYTTPCATFTPALGTHDVPAAAGAIDIQAGAGCNWTAATYQNPSWLTLTAGSSGSGAGTVTYSVKANDTYRPRSAWITIARQTFKVSQAFESVKPEGLRMEPASTAGRSAVEATPEPSFAFVYRDRNGWQDIQRAYMLFNTELSLANACYIEYDRATNVYRLGNDDGTGWATAHHPDHPGNGNPENAYCSFRNAGPPGPNEDAAGEEFYTALHFLFKKGSIGTRNVYLRAVDSAGMDSGWKQVGTWTVYLNEPPRSVAVAPGAGSGMSQTFVAEVSDPNGAIDVRNIFLQFSAPGEQRVCQVRASISDVVRLYLLADDNQSWLPAAYAGSAEIRQNSQCGFLASGAVTAKSGNTVTLTLPMVFMPGFAGTKAITLSTYDLSNVSLLPCTHRYHLSRSALREQHGNNNTTRT